LIILFDFIITRGEFSLSVSGKTCNGITVLLGPSGAGKSTLLNCLSGNLTPNNGDIKIGCNTVFSSDKRINLKPEKRKIGLVSQENLLFPHMDVRSNITFGFKVRKTTSKKIEINDVVSIFRIEHLLDQMPSQLSGGEIQRVSLARALCSGPDVLLLDEPFSSLDAITKGPILHYIKDMQKRTDIPVLLVTHSFSETLTLGDKAIVLNEGKIVKSGNPYSLLELRNNISGFPAESVVNYMKGIVIDKSNLYDKLGTVRVQGTDFYVPIEGFDIGTEVILQFSARDLIVATAKPKNVSARNILYGRVSRLKSMGISFLITVDIEPKLGLDVELTPESIDRLGITEGSKIFLMLKSSSCTINKY